VGLANKPGVLVRVSLVFARRGYNIDSLVVSPVLDSEFSRMTITCSGDPDTLDQITKQVVLANIALFLNILIIFAALAYFHATLTLPGIAGIVLTIGMAVDANVLIFERIREERQLGKPMAASITAGYNKTS
jgi:acetolactate synthase regulatory subunit